MSYPMDPCAIEAKSFQIIENEPRFQEATRDLSPQEKVVLRRVIHSTTDFDFVHNMIFHPNAISAGLSALKKGCGLIVDVEMVRAALNKRKLDALGCGIRCFIKDADVFEQAKIKGITRSVIAMRKAIDYANGSIIVIGNAPTALIEVVNLIKRDLMKPALLIGVPVGFVSAKESKSLLLSMNVPFITSLGSKGGSSVAGSIVNALLEQLL